MIKKIKQKVKTEQNKRLISNYISLTVLQAVNYIVPLIAFPYLVRVLGIELFGLWSFVYAVMLYLILIVDYGFELTATKNISIHRDDKDKTIEIYSSVLTIKILLTIFSFLILTTLILLFDKFYQNYILFYLAFGMVVGQALFPAWFFQGVERMKYITLLNATSKIIFTIALFLFVKEQSDIVLVAILNSLGFMVAAFISLYIVKKEFDISFKLQSFSAIKFYFIEGWYVFSSRIAVSLYSSLNIIILSFMTNNTIVGYYAIAEKIFFAASGIFKPLLQTLYPFFATIYQESKEKFYHINRKLTLSLLFISVPLSISVFYFSEDLLKIVTGMTDIDNTMLIIMKIFSVIIAFSFFGDQFTRMLITIDKGKLLQKIVFIAGIVNIIFAPIMVFFFNAAGIAFLSFILAVYIGSTKGYFVMYKFKRENV